eukprot:6207758-Pleurochrysis_carterae.AAC.2
MVQEVDDYHFDTVERIPAIHYIYLVKRKEWGDDQNCWEAECDCIGALDALHELLVSQQKVPNYQYGHLQGVCKCHRQLVISRQDESIFKAH